MAEPYTRTLVPGRAPRNKQLDVPSEGCDAMTGGRQGEAVAIEGLQNSAATTASDESGRAVSPVNVGAGRLRFQQHQKEP